MHIKKWLLLLLCTITIITYAQENQESILNIGDPAPSLYLQELIKGKPIPQMEKGQIYVIEFWATWCRPCIAAMPHLSDLAREYKDIVTIIGVSIYEKESTSVEQIREFVDNMGDRMDYLVAIDDNEQMVNEWIFAAEEKDHGIPRTFVVDREGRLAWIGHPKDLDTVLKKMVDNNWNIDEASEKRNEQKRMEIVQAEARDLLFGNEDRPDSTFVIIEELIKKEPKLKNTNIIAFYTFRSLLQIDQKQAYEYGKMMLTFPDQNTSYSFIIDLIEWFSDKRNLIPEIYHLGAEAYREEINRVVYPEIVNMHNYYSNMAKWYWKAGDESKAIASQEKAIETLRNKKDFSMSDLAALETQLQQYKESENVK